MVRTRFAPSPTGYMHIGNLRTALYEYLIAKKNKGVFILRIEDTDQERYVADALSVIFKTLKIAGLNHDEGPDVGGDFGPYVQSERKDSYYKYAVELVNKKKAYYCFCSKERLDALHKDNPHAKYDRHCLHLSQEEIDKKLADGEKFVIRQLIPEGQTTFKDEVFGEITVNNNEMEDQVLLKSDMLPTYNFANVVDDHLMNITHVLRGCEYLSSTPKYNLLYDAFEWQQPVYMHLPLILNANGEKLSKRKGDASFEDLMTMGFLPEAVINYIALLGWSPSDNREIFSMEELIEAFDQKGLSKAPSIFDVKKLTWLNGEYFKNMDEAKFLELALPYVKEVVTKENIDTKKIASLVKSRINFLSEIKELAESFEKLSDYDNELFVHAKMKTTKEIALSSLKEALPVLEKIDKWEEEVIHSEVMALVQDLNIKNGQMLWPIRTALSGKPTSPCGALEIAFILAKEESIERIKIAIEKLGV